MAGKTMRVLLIDDEETIVRAMAALLEDLGCNVVRSADGREGLELALRERFDVIISDIRMPRLGGLELVSALREHGLSVPVLLISGHGDERITEKAAEVGAAGFLQKPVALRELVEYLRQYGMAPTQEEESKQGRR